ncbi:Uncharacterised protein [Vibrio cholerae]|uniref:Uncharacterized protein n=1 Tax=Vibrio cholerae TaxID=666 RepID=A0A655ZRC9_VIBCL|nr:Uncharacterised protein [Vibrio cholerae]
MLEVGASSNGQASRGTVICRWISANFAMLELGLPVMLITRILKRLSTGSRARISDDSPELEMASTISPRSIIPRSPCEASPGCTKKADVPVLAKVAAIFLPMWPDLPIPITTTLPV